MKTLFQDKNSRILFQFFIIWGVINLIQAFFTPINNDEAYYWMYSKYPDWGYYDHPPMIALMIKAGYAFFRNELGVRLFIVISNTLTIFVLWILAKDERIVKSSATLYFISLVLLLPVFNIYGFIATPDVPLLLFTILFLLAYKKFLEDQSLMNALYIGLAMSALMYSKYHGALVIFFVIISNLTLLRNPRFYLSCFLGVVLFTPHLLWQYFNNFPTFSYHLVERVSGLDISNVPEYLGNILLINNPVVLPVCIWLIYKFKPADRFERALYFILSGFIIFFFVSSFRYHVEPHWTAVISIPVVIILFRKAQDNKKILKTIKVTTLVMIPLLVFARIALMFDFLPVSFLKKEYHRKKEWAKEIAEISQGRPVIFTNSYQDPSVFTFYSGIFSHSLNNLSYRKTQFDLWDFEEKLNGKEVLYVPHYLTETIHNTFNKLLLSDGDSIFYKAYKNFQSLQRECVILSDELYNVKKDTINVISLKVFNPYNYTIRIKDEEFPVVFQLAFIKDGTLVEKVNLDIGDSLTVLNPGDTISLKCHYFPGNLPEGRYKIAICNETGVLYDTYSSRFCDALITDQK